MGDLPLRHNAHEDEESIWSNWETLLTASPTVKPPVPQTQVETRPSTTDIDDMPSPTITYPPFGNPTGGPLGWKSDHSSRESSTLQTVPKSDDKSAQSEHLGYTTLSTTIMNSGPLPSSTDTGSFGGNNPERWGQKGPSNHGVLYGAAVVVPVVVIAVIALLIFFLLRKRKREKKEKALAQAQMQEMKARNQQPLVAAHYTSTSPPPPPPPFIQSQYAVPPSHSPLQTSMISPPPVILGPITSGTNGAYFTGIDTSDIVSMHERTGLGNPFADGNSLQEEPPPPYRPRSVAPSSIAPSSRNSSLRMPSAAHSQTNLIARHDQTVRSPFDDPDPRDDDALSDVSVLASRRNEETLSVVSDLSYQNDHVQARPPV